MLMIKAYAKKVPHGFYLSFGHETHHRNYVDVQFDLDSDIVSDVSKARSWFKKKIADFYHTSENDLSPLWWYSLPEILR